MTLHGDDRMEKRAKWSYETASTQTVPAPDAVEKHESIAKTIWMDYGMVVVMIVLFIGCSLFMAGGVASVWFLLAGVLIMGIVQNAMNLSNVPTFYQYIVRGSILLLAVIFDGFKQRR